MKTSTQILSLAVVSLSACLTLSTAATAKPWFSPDATPATSTKPMTPPPSRTPDDTYATVIQRTLSMVSDPEARRLAESVGLNILNVTWEDTGRYKNSAVGPNISDMTIQVQQKDARTGQYKLNLMPVIRYPNFEDKSADVKLDNFFVLVGNEKGQDLQKVSLRELLGNLRRYLNQPNSWQGSERSLLADRDTYALVSAQACFLPIPAGGTAEFNPVLFNYQSYAGDPAVLTILATREGTSVTVIDNKRDGFAAGPTWGQRLFFNKNGERASLTGKRISDFIAAGGDEQTQGQSPDAMKKSGLNMVLLIQVPLKQKRPMAQEQAVGGAMPMSAMPAAPAMRRSDVEDAVIGHGQVEGPFTEIDNLAIERDPNFPIRVTVQFYKGTSNGVVNAADIQEIKTQINRVYDDADYVGSLVVDGDTGRPTEYTGPKDQPNDWWTIFWRRFQRNTNQSQGDVREMWQRFWGG